MNKLIPNVETDRYGEGEGKDGEVWDGCGGKGRVVEGEEIWGGGG